MRRDVLLGHEVHAVTHRRDQADGGVTALVEHADGSTSPVEGALLIGADGIHSAIRAQMQKRQGKLIPGGSEAVNMYERTVTRRMSKSGSSDTQ